MPTGKISFIGSVNEGGDKTTLQRADIFFMKQYLGHGSQLIHLRMEEGTEEKGKGWNCARKILN